MFTPKGIVSLVLGLGFALPRAVGEAAIISGPLGFAVGVETGGRRKLEFDGTARLSHAVVSLTNWRSRD